MASTDHLKPLFNRRLLAEALRAEPLEPSEAQRQIASDWAQGAATGALLKEKERRCRDPS